MTSSLIKRCKPLLGTYTSVQLSANTDEDTLVDISNQAFIEIQDIEKRLSFHNPDSELSWVNREAWKRPCKISDDLLTVLKTALTLSRLTNGRYDISIAPELMKNGLLPNFLHSVDRLSNWKDITLSEDTVSFNKPLLLDLGGIAKGYAVDKAFSAVSDHVDDVVINAGGDLRMKQWRGKTAEIKTPKLPKKKSTTINMEASALATTAAYYADNHISAIIDPKTRQNVHDKRSISVFASTGIMADALTKVALLAENATEVLTQMQASTAIIDHDGSLRSLS